MLGFPEQSPDSRPKKTLAILEFLSEFLVIRQDGVGQMRGCRGGAHAQVPAPSHTHHQKFSGF